MISKRELLTGEYSSEVLSYMLDMERSLPSTGDYIRTSRETGIETWMYDKLINWVVNLGEDIGVNIETAQLAITLINQFLSIGPSKKSVLQLIGIASLMVALKYHESITYTIDHAIEHTGNFITREDIQATELFLLDKLDWCLKIPTASEFSKQLLYITGVNYDFTKIIERSNSFAMVCYCDYSLNQFSPLTISIVSVVCALEQFNQILFRNQWLKLLVSKIDLDPPVLDQCKRALIHKLYRETPEQSKGRLECLRQSLMDLLSN
jgi:Cyclin, N-terminal domain